MGEGESRQETAGTRKGREEEEAASLFSRAQVTISMYQFGTLSRERLRGVHPDMTLIVSRGLLYSLYDFAIIEGVRTIERQNELVERGFSLVYQSKHLVQASGYAHAIDVMAVGDLNEDGLRDHQDKSLAWNHGVYTIIAGAMRRASEELGIPIRWGGEFKTFFDGPHFELGD